MSFAGPRPHVSPLDTSSSSTTPFAPRLTVTMPSRSCDAAGMKTPAVLRSAASTSGRCTSCPMCGEPISSSPSATMTRLTGIFFPAPRIACSAAIRGAGKKMPVNLVMVAEGEEEIGSPHIGQLVHRPEVEAALRKTAGVFMPAASQDLDGIVTVSLGAKGVVELELVSTGEKWGRGPGKDIHSSLKAMVDSPAWHLVKALDTLVSADGNTIAIDNYPQARPLSAEEKSMIDAVAKRRSEAQAK